MEKYRYLKMKLFFILLFIIILITPVYSITASVSNIKMVLYKEIPDDGPLVFDNKVIVNNENDFDVEIEIIPKDVWRDLVKVHESKFILGPDERKEAFYTVTINEPGSYGGDIIAAFRKPGSENKNAVALAQTLVVHVEGEVNDEEDLIGEDSNQEDEKDNLITGGVTGSSGNPGKIFLIVFFSLLGLIILILVPYFFIWRNRT